MPLDWVEPALMGIAFSSYFFYHAYLVHQYKHHSERTTLGHNRLARRLWVQTVMTEGKDMVAVQILRNTIMSSSLLASTSLTLSAVVAAYLVNTVQNADKTGIDLLGSAYLSPIHKFFVVMLCFAAAFYFYLQAVRACNHAGYIVTGATGTAMGSHSPFSPTYGARLLDRGASYNAAGTRAFYLAFISVIWIFGPIPAFVLMVIILAHLYFNDRAEPLSYVGGTPVTVTSSDFILKEPVDMYPPSATGVTATGT